MSLAIALEHLAPWREERGKVKYRREEKRYTRGAAARRGEGKKREAKKPPPPPRCRLITPASCDYMDRL